MKFPELPRRLKIPKLSRRLLVKICLWSFGGFLLYFVLLVWSYLIPDPELEAMEQRYDALFEYRTLPEPRPEPTEALDQTQLLFLDNEVEQFRQAAAVVASPAALDGLPQVVPGAFAEFLKGEISTKFPLIWPYVFAGSSIVIGNALGDEPVAAFYNPYFDVAILTRWTFDVTGETGFKLAKAYPVTGRAFVEDRASLPDDTQVWDVTQTRIFETALVKATQDFVAVFEERFPPAGREKADLSVEEGATSVALARIEDRVFYFLRWVIDAQDPKAETNYAAAIEELHDALSATSDYKLERLLPADNPQGPEFFFSLAPAVREGMQPYLVVEKNVIFVNPLLLTKGFISVHFEPGEKGYHPALVTLCNLGTETPVN